MMGCRKFCNYKHLLQVSRVGEWVDGCEFLRLLGSFATILKAKQGLPLDQTSYMDIAFGVCLPVGGF